MLSDSFVHSFFWLELPSSRTSWASLLRSSFLFKVSTRMSMKVKCYQDGLGWSKDSTQVDQFRLSWSRRLRTTSPIDGPMIRTKLWEKSRISSFLFSCHLKSRKIFIKTSCLRHLSKTSRSSLIFQRIILTRLRRQLMFELIIVSILGMMFNTKTSW